MATGTLAFRALLRSTAVGNATLTALISDRFYPSELALIESPTFPCVNFSIDMSTGADSDAPKIKSVNFGIWCWSSDSFDEALTVYETVFNMLERERLVSSDIFVLSSEINSPFLTFDSFSHLYGCFARWNASVFDRS